MQRYYFLETERLKFSHWNEQDLPFAKQLWGNQAVTKYISATGSFSNEEIEEKLEKEIMSQKKYNVQYWPLFEKDTEAFIGCCGLRMYDYQGQIFELGFHLLPEYWGKGYATEVAQAVIKYAFDIIHAKNLFAGHNPNNKDSKEILEKLGFTYIRDEFYEPTGLNHPSYLYIT